MPERLPFTSEGIRQKQEQLYSLPEDELRQQANSISQNFAEWVNTNFELSGEQQEYLQGLPEDDGKINGWWLASAVISKGNVTMQDPAPPEAQAKKKKKKTVKVAGTVEYDPTTGTTTTGVSVSIEWEWD